MSNMVDGRKLRAVVEQAEAYEADKKEASEALAELLDDAEKNMGFNKKVLKRFIKERKVSRAELDAEDDMLNQYREAWERWDSTPLGAAAEAREGDDLRMTLKFGDGPEIETTAGTLREATASVRGAKVKPRKLDDPVT